MKNDRSKAERYVVYNACFGGFGLSLAGEEWLHSRGYELSEYGPISRHDQLLALCVIELGSEAASGSSAQLAVHKLKGDRYIIDEYDGSESVVEPDDINWIILK
jgi:hypothetical protein